MFVNETENAESVKKSWSIPINDQVNVVQFCPYSWAGSLIAVGGYRLKIAKCIFQDDDAEIQCNGYRFDVIRELNHGCRIHAISWSPETSLDVSPKIIRFATAGADKKLRIFNSTLKDDSVQIIEGHGDYINDVAYEPSCGSQLATVSDDYTCRIWGSDGTAKVTFTLAAPGTSVAFHKEDPKKLMVAQKNGIIRFYNLLTQRPIFSVDCGSAPLLAADWNPADSLMVGCVAGNHCYIWNIAVTSRPQESYLVHSDGATSFAWARNNSNLIATIGMPGNQVKVTNLMHTKVALEQQLQVVGSLSWHHNLSILAVASDNKILMWKVD